MPKPDSRTPAPPTPAGPEAGRDAAHRLAIAALLHRLNGGLHNAALAFELSKRGDGDAGSDRILDRGLAGVFLEVRVGDPLLLVGPPRPFPWTNSIVDSTSTRIRSRTCIERSAGS